MVSEAHAAHINDLDAAQALAMGFETEEQPVIGEVKREVSRGRRGFLMRYDGARDASSLTSNKGERITNGASQEPRTSACARSYVNVQHRLPGCGTNAAVAAAKST
jgi:hypothetical protein